jgi:DNA-directed RNA polymerase specialized sigma24 family protein
MEEGQSKRTRWTLTGDAFRLLLEFLDADAARAGQKYERIRNRLIAVFGWEHCPFPEECADEAINRVAKALAGGTEIQSLDSFLHGVVRLILKEQYREETRRAAALRQYQLQSGHAPENAEMQCLERCMAGLPKDGRRLIERYYEGDRSVRIRNRQLLAAELEIPLNALRNRAMRLRAKLESCLGDCMRKHNTETD